VARKNRHCAGATRDHLRIKMKRSLMRRQFRSQIDGSGMVAQSKWMERGQGVMVGSRCGGWMSLR
jgi:hypothetical protein